VSSRRHLLSRRTFLTFVSTAALLVGCRSVGKSNDEARGPKVARVVTIGSAITEAAFALGSGPSVVGVDTSSLYPDEATRLPQIGYQRAVAAEGVLSLQPTLVVASDEAGPPAALAQLKAAGVAVEIVPSGFGVAGARARLGAVAKLLGKDATPLLAQMDKDLARQAARLEKSTARPKVLALYARGGGTLLVFGQATPAHTMIELGGGKNAVESFEGTRPLTAEGVVGLAPEVLLIPERGLASLGGIDGLLKQPGVAETPAGKARRVVAVDDVLLLGFGPRLAEAVGRTIDALHPELAPKP
jgi:iron complex transport system substrate-binding protein